METKHYWFRSKKYGFGWQPCSWQGWMVLFLYLVILMLLFIFYDKQSHSVTNFMMNILPTVVFATFTLMWIMYAKGEPHRWKVELEVRE